MTTHSHSATPLYECRDLTQRYSQRTVLRLPELTVQRGEVLTVQGPNGAGKSTLLRILAFLEKPAGGTVSFYGTQGIPPYREVSLLLQEPYLLKRSVAENVAFGLKLRKRGNITASVCAALEAVGFQPGDMLHRPWYALSGGERQRVALAARLALQPLVLLLDEPTSNLDSRSALCIRSAIQQTARRGTTIIIASHGTAWLDSLNARNLFLQCL